MGRILLSICAVVVAVGLGASQSANPVGEQGRRQGGSAEGQARPQGQADAAAPSVETSLQSIARHVEASQTGPDAEKSEKRADRDLDAQEAMALWAKWMFFAAALTTVISGAGVFLIWRTLIHTRTAAKAGADIVTVTRDSAEHQLRAYVGIPQIDVVDEGHRFFVRVHIKNFGHTPANDVRLTTLATKGDDAETAERKTQKLDPIVLMPGDVKELPFVFGGTGPEMDRFRDGKRKMGLLIEGTYVDAFEKTRTVQWAMSYHHITRTFSPKIVEAS